MASHILIIHSCLASSHVANRCDRKKSKLACWPPDMMHDPSRSRASWRFSFIFGVAGWTVASGLVWSSEWLCSLSGMNAENVSTTELDADVGVSKIWCHPVSAFHHRTLLNVDYSSAMVEKRSIVMEPECTPSMSICRSEDMRNVCALLLLSSRYVLSIYWVRVMILWLDWSEPLDQSLPNGIFQYTKTYPLHCISARHFSGLIRCRRIQRPSMSDNGILGICLPSPENFLSLQ